MLVYNLSSEAVDAKIRFIKQPACIKPVKLNKEPLKQTNAPERLSGSKRIIVGAKNFFLMKNLPPSLHWGRFLWKGVSAELSRKP